MCAHASRCGTSLIDLDSPTEENTFMSVSNTPDDAACLVACKTTESYDAGVRLPPTGGCFLKNVDVSIAVSFDAPRFAFFILCTVVNHVEDIGGEVMGGDDMSSERLRQ